MSAPCLSCGAMSGPCGLCGAEPAGVHDHVYGGWFCMTCFRLLARSIPADSQDADFRAVIERTSGG